MRDEKFDVGIIGGGVIGLSCAWRLAQAGAKVAIFERGEIGREASWAAAGMLAAQCEAAHHPPSDDESSTRSRAAMFSLCLQSRAMYASFADELFDATGVDIELSITGHKRNDWRTPGILYVQTRDDDAAIANLAAQHDVGRVTKNTPSPFDFAPTVKFRHLQLQERVLWLPDEGQVENRKLTTALREAAIRYGVVIRQSLPVKSVKIENERVVLLQTSHESVFCERVLLCAGAWSSRIKNLPINCIPSVLPIAGQMISLRGKLPFVAYSSDVYLVPRRDGRLLVGATVEQSGFQKRATVQGCLQLLEAARRLKPDLNDHTIEEHWCGLRPATPDGLPILGKTPLENFHVATGHFRNGILLAPITAKLMTDCIINGVEPPREFGIERFQSSDNNSDTGREVVA